jgi:hypothetical protein
VSIGAVPAPGWDKQTYGMQIAKAALSVDAEPYLPAGTSGDVGVAFTVPTTAGGARDVDLALTAPPGWTLRPDGPTSRARVRPGETFTARWTVTPADDASPYALLTATATYSQGAAAKTLTERRAVQVPPPGPAGNAYVSDLPLVRAANGWGPVEKDRSNGEGAAGDGQRLSVAGTGFDKGLGVHAPSSIRVWLGGKCTSFTAMVGVDDEVGDAGSVAFSVAGDDRSLARSRILTGASPGEKISVDVTGVRWLDLEVDDAGDNAWSDHAAWADARLTCP